MPKIGADDQYCMIFGLCMQAIFGFALSGAYQKLVPNHIAGFAVMYGIFLAFGVSSLAPGRENSLRWSGSRTW